MKKIFFRKGLIIVLICILILPTIALATTQSTSDYNLKIKVKNAKFLHREGSLCQLLVNVTNEGPDVSDSYFVSVGVYTLFTRGQAPKWFTLFFNCSYTGLPLAPNSYNMTQVTYIDWVTGWYLVRATVNSNDNNDRDNTSYCLQWIQFHYR